MRKVLVTGSTQGIGLAIAERLVKEGYEVIVHCSRDLEKAERICREIGAAAAVTCDLGAAEEVNTLPEKTGKVDALILNASVQYKHVWDEVTEDELEKQLDVNVKSTIRLMQLYYPYMKEQGFGRIVTIGSVNQTNNHPELSVYGATKNAVNAFVKNVAKHTAAYGVTVNNIAPGAIATPRNAAVFEDDVLRKKVEAKIPMGRFGKAEEIAGVAAMLLSEDGAYITGADIYVDGGMGL